ncbi:hypothetical protein [Haloarcula amylovorans]|nr:hypothetical protein [Halomicroarcula amylolytica]
MSRYGGVVDDPGVPNADGESWEDAAERIRGNRRRLHPLVSEVADDV